MTSRLSSRVGAILWISQIQFFAMQILAAYVWRGVYDFNPRFNTISDLGNTACGIYDNRYVCSPWHIGMNVSFVLLGLAMALGAHALRHHLPGRSGTIGKWLMVLAGIGTMIVGFFPENSIGWLHTVGAALPFVAGNLALLCFVVSLHKTRPAMARLAAVFAPVALIALVLFVNGANAGPGLGALERITAYPQTVWMIIFGLSVVLWPGLPRKASGPRPTHTSQQTPSHRSRPLPE